MADPKQNKAKTDPDKVDEQSPAKLRAKRVAGARFLGGAWVAEDGTLLTDAEAQQAHRAMDKAAAEARERAIKGGR